MRSSDNQTLTVQEDRKQIFCICSGETVNDCSVCAPAPVHCPHPCLTLQVEHCQHSYGCRKDRETGKHLGHPLGHQCPPRCCSGCDSHNREIPALWGTSHASWGNRETWYIHALFLQFCITNLSSLALKGAKILCQDRKTKETILTCH